jgi:hypothetical protein
MLVYGKGQFFLPHQDSEKDDAMVGTLVVSLPAAHTGGELVIEHAGQRRTHRASKRDLALVAFYADCRHEVTPVRTGYRVTLTFNLLSRDETPSGASGPVGALAHCLTAHFATPATPRYVYRGRDLAPPNRLVYLLDHEYTQRGLGWNRLKGVDVERAALLRAAAEEAGCEAVLALAEVKETWDAYPSGGRPWDDWGYDDVDDEDHDDEDHDDEDHDDEDHDHDDYELNELIDDEITLSWWTGPDGRGGESISLPVPDFEVAATTPNARLEPYESAYEGYMGNYGNTLDRWYHRSAVVVWPRGRGFAARAEAGSGRALDELRDRLASGDVAAARVDARSLAPFWEKTAPQAGSLGTALEVAAGLGEAGTAKMLLAPFGVEMLAPEHATGLAAAAERYGEKWTREVVGGWFGAGYRAAAERYGWVEGLPELCRALHAAGASGTVRTLLAETWDCLDGDLLAWLDVARSETRRPMLAALGTPLVRLLRAADDDLRDEIAAALRGFGDSVLECLVPALRSPEARRAAGLGTVAGDCAQRLAAIAERPLRAEGDWSIAWSGGCGCDLCDELAAFLGSASRRTFEWPLAQGKRSHVHSLIDRAALPVRHQTRRQGRPYTLVLTKTERLFTSEKETRRKAGTDLAWLTSHLSRLA